MAQSDQDRIQFLVLERVEPAANMARYYVLSVEPALIEGCTALVRQWGRIGKPGCRRIELHADRTAAAEALDVWLARKLARGYQLRTSAAA